MKIDQGALLLCLWVHSKNFSCGGARQIPERAKVINFVRKALDRFGGFPNILRIKI